MRIINIRHKNGAEIKDIKTRDRDEWLELRSNFIGGSDAASVVGLNPYKSAFALWAEKTNRAKQFEGNLATQVGTYLEEFVAKKFAAESGKKVRRNNRSMVNSKYPFAIANIDREIVGEDALLEIKTTSEMNLKKFKNGEYPANYYCQIMHYLAITGKKKGYLAVLIGNREFKVFEIERDEEEIEALMNAERDFWGCVEKDVAPVPDGSKSTSETISDLYGESQDRSASAELVPYDVAFDRYCEISRQIKELKVEQDQIANEIKVVMGDAGKGETERYKVSWISSVRSTFDSKKYMADHPQTDFSQYFKQTSTRTFRVTEK